MIVTIKDSKTTAVIDSFGAQLISMKDENGKEYIWQRDPEIWPRCSPLLFPTVGNVRNDKTIFEGEWYELPKHGFCKETDFEVTDQKPDSVSFTIHETEITKTMYPYDFRLTLTYSLKDGVLSMDYRVDNTDSRTIFYCIGAHPGFICPLEEGEKFEDYVLEFEQEETACCTVYDLEKDQFDHGRHQLLMDHTNTLPLNYRLFDANAVFFEDIRSRKVSLVNPETKKGVEVDYPDFETIAFWTPDHAEAPFLCIEPWNGSAVCSDEDDEFIHKHHLQILEKGQSRSYHLGIRIL